MAHQWEFLPMSYDIISEAKKTAYLKGDIAAHHRRQKMTNRKRQLAYCLPNGFEVY